MKTLSPLIKELFDNFPEYTENSPYDCQRWIYKDFDFKFYDTEENKMFYVGGPTSMYSAEMLNSALEKCITYLSKGNSCSNEFLSDSCNWDAPMLQTLLDFIFYGEARYS